MISAAYYHIVYLYLIIILTFCALSGIGGKSYYQIKRGTNNFFFALILSLILAIWLGHRPVSGFYFGDTSNYALTFDLMKYGISVPGKDSGEWVWNGIMYACAQVMDVSSFFTLVDLGYFGFTLWACRRFTPNNVLISLLFTFGALSFFTYGTNGIRNGLACAMTLTVFSYLTGNKRDKIMALAIAFCTINIHRTTLLPLGMAISSMYFVKSFKQAYSIWILSILISLVAGEPITSFFAGLGFDDRLSYLTEEQDKGMFSNSGFRWDFLIYSMMPIVLGYYVVIKRGIQDRTYSLLLNTYTLANAFWVMVIRANYSNRFAYLSWFMYPIVLAYPLLCLDIWGNEQGKRLQQIMLAHVGFTWFMQTIY